MTMAMQHTASSGRRTFVMWVFVVACNGYGSFVSPLHMRFAVACKSQMLVQESEF